MRAKLSADQFEQLADALGGYDDDGDGLRPDYSGRGMYGSTCVGFVTHEGPSMFSAQLAKILARAQYELHDDEELSADDLIEMIERLGAPSSDSMGLSAIYYYRGIEVEGHEREERF